MKLSHPMKPYYCPIIFSLFLLMPIMAKAATPTPATESALAAADEAEHAALRQVGKIYEEAIASGDLSPMTPYFSGQTSGVVLENKEFTTLPELQKIYDDLKTLLGPGWAYRVKLNPKPSLLFGDIAIAYGSSDEYVKDSANREFNYTSTWTAIMKKQDGQWKLLRSQVTMDPFHNPIVTFFVKRASQTFGLGGFILGGVLGLGLGVYLRRPKASQPG